VFSAPSPFLPLLLFSLRTSIDPTHHSPSATLVIFPFASVSHGQNGGETLLLRPHERNGRDDGAIAPGPAPGSRVAHLHRGLWHRVFLRPGDHDLDSGILWFSFGVPFLLPVHNFPPSDQGRTHFGSPRKIVSLGPTTISQEQFLMHLRQISARFGFASLSFPL